MASAICIITSSGMKCISSPLKEHHPGDRECHEAPANAARDAQLKEIRALLRLKRLGLSKGKQDLIAKVVTLMLAAHVGEETPFTIVRVG